MNDGQDDKRTQGPVHFHPSSGEADGSYSLEIISFLVLEGGRLSLTLTVVGVFSIFLCGIGLQSLILGQLKKSH